MCFIQANIFSFSRIFFSSQENNRKNRKPEICSHLKYKILLLIDFDIILQKLAFFKKKQLLSDSKQH